MQRELYIQFDNGKMAIHLDAFFPCSRRRLKRLMQLIVKDWEHADERMDELREYLRYRLEECRYLKGLAERGAGGADTRRVVRLRNEVLKFEGLLECVEVRGGLQKAV